jgi:acyl carrier protein
MAIQLKLVKMNKDQVKQMVTRMLYDKYEITLPKDESHLKDDLGLDSLDVLELAMDIEKETKISFDDSDIEGISTVGSLVDFVFEKM